ncbi:SMC family ATPase [Nonomuraea sp. NPDC050310]|uniref:SMC family ATPase n=1 Tax=Nonomuraea sp. NPDC050310 TaxID=3154935 RepID=UPI0033FAD531
MRPLQLTLENFGSFREPLTVDFTDVEYFALVGPTGAGKSTVIDAICFALYGTVPRWGRENSVAYALAPSAAAGKVGLLFESGGKRYGVVRAMARDAKGIVRTREARLEELSGGWEEVTRSLAEGENVTAEVQRLTGLEYKFFTQCVVLPQGRFAEFLHAKPNERQDLLVQLLDAEVYNEIRLKATREEEVAKQAALHAREQRAEFTATPQAEAEAEAGVLALRTAQRELGTELDLLRARDAELERIRRESAELAGRLAGLRALTMPPEVPTLAASAKQAAVQVAELEERAAVLAVAEQEAEAALAGLGEVAGLRAALAAFDTVERLAAAAASARADSERSLASARAAAAQAVEEARRSVAQARTEAVEQARAALAAEREQARRVVAEALEAGRRSLAEARASGERSLDQARADGEKALVAAREEGARSLAEARRRAAAASVELESLTAAAARAEAALAAAVADHDRLRDAHAAAGLAARLTLGAPCPVCLREVTHLPPTHQAPPTSAPHRHPDGPANLRDRPGPNEPTDHLGQASPGGPVDQAAVEEETDLRGLADTSGSPDLADHRAAGGPDEVLRRAERRADAAKAEDERARKVLGKAETTAAMLADRATRLADELAEQAARAERELAALLDRQRTDLADRLAALENETTARRTALERDTTARLTRREQEITHQRARREQELTDQLTRREHDLAAQTARLEAELTAQVARLDAELAQHRATLPEGADRAELSARLAAATEADRRAVEARKAARACRTALDEARRTAAEVSRRAEQAWAALGEARDRLMVLGLDEEAAPPVDRTDLHAAWGELIAWRNRIGTAARARADETEQRLAELAAQRAEQAGRISARLAEHGVAAGDRPDEFAAAVATALARAESTLERVREDLARIAELERVIAEKDREAEVAHELALRLRANAFERWLCAEALAVLVATASETLRELSDGQYELELGDRSEIEVIDHAEAGLRRSARTLSGGETFQAALALALALSGTVARGLDSIFLDEGFGTLDPATLDTVAATLERLAAGQERMVGVVTHVQALADRVPVRFAVSRDATGSHLRRVDA